MPDSLNYVLETAKLIGLKLPVEREASVAESVEVAIRQVEEIRESTTPHPAPEAYDAAWSSKK